MTTNPAKWFMWAGAVVALLLVIVTSTLTLVLPAYIETKLIPQVANAFNLTPETVDVRRIGWWGADLGPIRLSSHEAPAIAVGAIQLDYSPISLLRGEVEGLSLVGLDITAAVTPAGVSIAGMRAGDGSISSDSGNGVFRIDSLLPITLGRLRILQSRLLLTWNDRQYTFPVDVHLSTGQMKAGILKGHADLTFLGNPIRFETALDQSENSVSIGFDAPGVLLERLSHIGLPTIALDLAGKADLNGLGTLTMQPLELTRLSLTGRFENARIATAKGGIQSGTPGPGAGLPLMMTLAGEDLSDLQWSCAPFQLSGPLNLTVNAFNGNLAYTKSGWSLKGALNSRIPQQSLLDTADIDTDMDIDWLIEVAAEDTDTDAPGSILFDLNGQGGGPVNASLEGGKLSIQKQSLRAKGHFRDGAFVSKGRWAATALRFVSPQGQISAPSFTLNHEVSLQSADSGPASSMAGKAILPEVKAVSGLRRIDLPIVTLDIAGRAKPRQPWVLDARLNCKEGRISDSGSGLRIENVSVDLPLAWPAASAARPGQIDMDAIQWNRHPLGGLSGVLQQTPQGMTMALRHTSQMIPGLRAFIKGGIDQTGARIEARIPPYQMTEAIDLGRFSPAAAGIRAIAKLSAFAKLNVDSQGPHGSGRVKINQGQLRQDERAMLLDGIDLAVHVDDLLQLKSAPKQRLQVAVLSFGDFRADHLDVDFQIEDPQTLFIEKAGLDWSQGRINTSALRINSAKAEYDLTLFCDRLNLAQLLEQLGSAEASGDGTVNGRIPIRWTQGRLVFDNGFLFSTPGQTGVIQLSGTQALLSDMPPGSPQYTQLDIATEALKDYSYQWAKLNLQSEADILLLKLQFDGKPNRLLPFSYDPSLGQFKRVSGAGQADFKGISIDLNFRSPLNEIIHYKDLFKPQ